MAASWETIKVDGSDMRMYLSIPDGSGPFPAVLVSQHGPGVNEFIQDIVNNLAKEGYVACAPELYHRITEEMLADGSSAGQHLNDPQIVADINATVDFYEAISPLTVSGWVSPAFARAAELPGWQPPPIPISKRRSHFSAATSWFRWEIQTRAHSTEPVA